MVDHSDHMFEPWRYYQFMHTSEVVVVVDETGKAHTYTVVPGGRLARRSRQLTVREGIPDTQGFFDLYINEGRRSSIVKMRHHADGIARGSKEHYGGNWTKVSAMDMRMAVKGVPVPPAPPVAPRPWAPTNDPLGIHHPSGLPDHDLEDCKHCAASYGACYECLNTGRVPKQQRSNDIMNTAEMIAVIQIQQGAKIVACAYQTREGAPGGVYHFKNVAALPLVKDDLVVVQTRQGFSLATVVDPDVRANAVGVGLGELKHVVNKVDLAALNKVLEAENNAQHALALSEVTERMNKFREQIGSNTFDSMATLLAPPKE